MKSEFYDGRFEHVYDDASPTDEVQALKSEIDRLRKEQMGVLTKFAAECHRTKWQFDLSEDYQPTKSAARTLIVKAFDELHRIGDMALKIRSVLQGGPR